MKKPWLAALGMAGICALAFAGGGNDGAAKAGPENKAAKSIFINMPELTGFSETGYSGLPDQVRGALSDIFVNYSGMRVVIAGDVPDYFLAAKIEKHPSRYAISLVARKEAEGMDAIEDVASSIEHAYSLDQLLYGNALNLAVKKLFAGGKLGVTLTAEAGKALDKPRDTRYAERGSAVAKARTASPESFGREQNSNIAKELGQSLEEAGLRLPESMEGLALPEFNAPAGFAPPGFTPPAIRTVKTSSTVEGIREDLARYRAAQEANKAAVEEQQRRLLQQREAILVQWQNFLGEVEKRRQLIGAEEQKLLRIQEKLESGLREGEAYYRASPPFRILYNPDPKLNIDLESETVDLWFQIASEPTSLRALKARLDNLLELNRSFARVNKAYEEVNTAMAARFGQVVAAMGAVKDGMDRANAAGASLGGSYKVEPQSADWTVPPGEKVSGGELKTSWPVDYPRTFSLTVSLLVVRGEEAIESIASQTLSLSNSISWKGPLEPESASVWGAFNNLRIADLGEGGVPMVRIERVNDLDVEAAAIAGYIEIIPDGERTAAVGKQEAMRKSWRSYWSSPNRLNSLGAAVGTAGINVTPAFLASGRLTFSPFNFSFFELGSDFGLVHGEWDVRDVEYLSIAPYLHWNLLVKGERGGGYIGGGGGMSFSRYTYPSESGLDPVMTVTPVADFNLGALFFIFSHSVFDLRWTIKTNFNGLDHRFTLGYMYRFGYMAKRYGGAGANL
jgi:hypothetical protein